MLAVLVVMVSIGTVALLNSTVQLRYLENHDVPSGPEDGSSPLSCPPINWPSCSCLVSFLWCDCMTACPHDFQFILLRWRGTWLPRLNRLWHVWPAQCALQQEDWPLLGQGLPLSSRPWLGWVQLQLISEGKCRHKGSSCDHGILNYSAKRTQRTKKG